MKRRPHWRMDSRAGWRLASPDGRVTTGDTLSLAPEPGEARPLVDGTGSLGGFAEARAVAVGPGGDVYVLDAINARVLRYDVCHAAFSEVPCVGGLGGEPRQLREPGGLAFHTRGDLLVADTGNGRVQVFTQKGWTLRKIIGPPGEEWRPTDVAVAPDGRVWVTDELGWVHVYDALYQHRASYDLSDRLEGPLLAPSAVAASCDGSIYIVEGGRPSVLRLDPDAATTEFLVGADALEGRFCPVAVAVDAEGRVYVTERVTGRLQVAEVGDTRLRSSAAYEGAGLALAFSPDGAALVGGARVVRMDAGVRRASRGHVRTAPSSSERPDHGLLDGRRPDCQWHRVVIDATVPEGTSVEVRTLTSNEPLPHVPDVDSARWLPCAVLHAREGEWDALVRAPGGRYLYLWLRLSGDGEQTPHIRSIRAEYPRTTAADLLPSVYKAELEGWDFLQRFVSIFEGVRERDERLLSGFSRVLAVGAAPASEAAPEQDLLAWLSSWVGIVANGDFSERRRRALLRAAPELYAWRGTPRGLKAAVRAYTGMTPTIMEHHRLRRWLFLGESRLGDAADLWGHEITGALQVGDYSRIGDFVLADRGDPTSDPLRIHAHRFTVYAPSPRPLTSSERATLERVVEEAKPAHTVATVIQVGARMRIGKQARIGVDTIVGAYPAGVRTGEARLGRESVLGPSPEESSPPTLRVGSRSRIGAHTILD